MTDFILWLEFENIVLGDNWDIENQFSIVQVYFPDGRYYGLNVWTYKFLETSIKMAQQNGDNLNGQYLVPPDLFVKELTRECIENAIRDLLKIDNLENALNPSVYAGSDFQI